MIAKKDIEVGKSYSCSIKGEKIIVSIVADSEMIKRSYNFYKLASALYFKEKFYLFDYIRCVNSYSFYIVNIFFPVEERYASCVYMDKYDINRLVKFNSKASHVFQIDFDKCFLLCRNPNSKWNSFDCVMFYRPANISEGGIFPVRSVEFCNIFLEKPSAFCLSKDEITHNLILGSFNTVDLSNLKELYSILTNLDDGSEFLRVSDVDNLYLPFVFNDRVKLNAYNILELNNKGYLNTRFLPDEFDEFSDYFDLLFKGSFWEYKIGLECSSTGYSYNLFSWNAFFRFIVGHFGSDIVNLFEKYYFNITCSKFLFKDGFYCPVYTIKFS